MRRVEVGVEQADGDRLHAFRGEAVYCRADTGLVEGGALLSPPVYPATRREAEIARNQLGRVWGAVVPDVLPDAPADGQRIAKTLRCEETHPRPPVSQEGVRRNRRAVDEALAAAEKGGGIDPERIGGAAQGVDDPLLGAAGAGGRLGQADQPPPFIGDDEIGEGAAHIDADAVFSRHDYPLGLSGIAEEKLTAK